VRTKIFGKVAVVVDNEDLLTDLEYQWVPVAVKGAEDFQYRCSQLKDSLRSRKYWVRGDLKALFYLSVPTVDKVVSQARH